MWPDRQRELSQSGDAEHGHGHGKGPASTSPAAPGLGEGAETRKQGEDGDGEDTGSAPSLSPAAPVAAPSPTGVQSHTGFQACELPQAPPHTDPGHLLSLDHPDPGQRRGVCELHLHPAARVSRYAAPGATSGWWSAPGEPAQSQRGRWTVLCGLGQFHKVQGWLIVCKAGCQWSCLWLLWGPAVGHARCLASYS